MEVDIDVPSFSFVPDIQRSGAGPFFFFFLAAWSRDGIPFYDVFTSLGMFYFMAN